MGHGVGILLLTAVAGYWVLERAETHKGDLRRVGKVLGALIIAVSLIGIICTVWCLTSSMGYCPFPKKAGYCPMGSQAAPAP